MNLYNNKDSNIRKTWLLFTLFLVVVIGIGWTFAQIYRNPSILYFAVVFSIFMNIISYWYSDKIVLKINKAVLVKKKNAPELYNIAENLAITAGLPMPKIYLMNEDQPNAFATGRNAEHAVIAVTQGLLRKLDRSELEGVIAHELSHIGNRDILLSTVIVILVGFISIISDMFMRSAMWGSFNSRDDEDRGGGLSFIIGLVLAILAPISAMLIQLAISRKREFLADSLGALLTRYPEGLASALEKISGDQTPLSIINNTTNHLWLNDPIKGKQKKINWLYGLFLTHPPVENRIKALMEIKI
ncbi:MAG: M48 family metallopeptidase [Patescibacteria group bacterium]|nr:M48 family metallopeptidase [Patescibacteria group bacterium]